MNQKKRLPYLYENFNISAWFVKLRRHALKVPAIAHLQNALIAAFNKYPHMPKYIIVIPDKDILKSIEIYDNGIKKVIYSNMCWLLQQFGRNLNSRRDDFRNKNTGAVPPTFTRVLWVQMLARPISDDPELARIWKLRRKFNEVLNDLFAIEQYMHVVPIKDMEEFKYFDNHGNLTNAGKECFWLSLNDQIKAFEYHRTDLRPSAAQKSKSDHPPQHDRGHDREMAITTFCGPHEIPHHKSNRSRRDRKINESIVNINNSNRTI